MSFRNPALIWRCWAVGLALLGLVGGGVRPAVATPPVPLPPVVVLVLDELPLTSLLDGRGRIDAEQFPHFAALAEDSYWFRRATSVAQSTRYAVPAILSGRYPDKTRRSLSEDYANTLFTYLAPTHRLRAVESYTQLCPLELCGPPAKGWSAEAHFEQFLDHLDPDSTPGSPGLYFAHVVLPHTPWRYLPSGKRYLLPSERREPRGLTRHRWTGEPWEVLQGYQRHLLQVARADRLVGEMVDRLRGEGLWDEALIVVTADHGASFRPGAPMRNLTPRNIVDILSVPLFIKLPGQQRGGNHDRPAPSIDILPTLAEALGRPLPFEVDGRPLLGDAAMRRREKTVIAFATGKRATGPKVEMKTDARARDGSVATKLALFRPGSERLFRIGRHAELIGQRPEGVGLRVASSAPLLWELERPLFYEHVDLESSYLPARVSGRLMAISDAPRRLAVALNGVVRAVSQTYQRDPTRFSSMVPESAFRNGRNEVELFLVHEMGTSTGDRSAPVLERLRRRSTDIYGLEENDNDARVLRLPGGGRAVIDAKVLRGAARWNSPRWESVLNGWAASVEGQPAEAVLLFVDGRFVARVATGRKPTFGPGAADPALQKTGFVLELPPQIFVGARAVEVFALLGERAKSLRLVGWEASAAAAQPLESSEDLLGDGHPAVDVDDSG